MNDPSSAPSPSPALAERIRLPRSVDERGALLPFDFANLPFTPRRLFVVQDVPVGQQRGRHAHRSARQLFVCLAGRIGVELRYQGAREYLTLKQPGDALLVPAGTWTAQDYLDAGSMLLVMGSEEFDPKSFLDEAS